MPAPVTNAPSPQQLNALQRQSILQQAVQMKQQIFSQTIYPGSNPTLNITPRNVGLMTKFVVEVTASLNNSGTGTAALTDFGLSNLLSNVSFTDLNNNIRINTTGSHLSLIANAKRMHPMGSTADFNQRNGTSVSQLLNVPPASWPVFQSSSTVAAGASTTARAVFEVPLAYSHDDLRGAVYGNVINATMQLSLTFNTNVFAASSDATGAVYSGSAGGFTSAQVNVYQYYYDQLPVGQRGVILPILDLSTIYELKSTNFTSIAATSEFPVQYANFRDFLSVFAVYNSSPTGTGRKFGQDVNYWALQSANFTNLWKIGPLLAAQEAREVYNADLPAGTYYFSHRRKPVSTTQYGNMELILNPSAADPNAYLNIFWEDMALVNTLTAAGSLAG